MDRRSFLRTGLALGATAPVLASCASTPTAVTTGTPTTAMPTPAPETRDRTVPNDTSTTEATQPSAGGARILLAWFSRPGENYYYGDRIDLEVGNTQVVAEMIAAALTVDTFRIDAADPYPNDYEQTVARNVEEEQADIRPEIVGPLPDVSGYDTVLLGSPVWNSQTPMIMRTFVEGLDLAGKTLHPFVTYAVSGMGRVRSDYVGLLPETTVTEGLAVQGEEAAQARPDVDSWLRQLNLQPA